MISSPMYRHRLMCDNNKKSGIITSQIFIQKMSTHIMFYAHLIDVLNILYYITLKTVCVIFLLVHKYICVMVLFTISRWYVIIANTRDVTSEVPTASVYI